MEGRRRVNSEAAAAGVINMARANAMPTTCRAVTIVTAHPVQPER
jgi:hypothetical protein